MRDLLLLDSAPVVSPNTSRRHWLAASRIACAAALLWPLRLAAQAPFSPAVLERGEVHARLDALGYRPWRGAPPDRETGGWLWGLPSVTVGLPGAVEVGLGLSVVRPRPVTLATADLLPTAKWQLWADPAKGRAVAVGALAFLPFARRTPEKIPTDAYGFAFVAASTTAPVPLLALVGERAPTVTVAAFEKVGRGRAWLALNDESRRGVMLALDQPLPRTLTRRAGADALGLSLNWVSGQTVFGYATASVVAARGAWQGSMGYARGNRPNQNHGPQVALGRSW